MNTPEEIAIAASKIGAALAAEIDLKMKEWVAAERNGERFVADFNLLWRWAGYTQKGNAKTKMEKILKLGTDYTVLSFSANAKKPSTGGRPSQSILLTMDSSKHFLLQAPTSQGRAVREYFIEVEKRWRLLKDNVDNGRIRMEDKLTGEVIDNQLQDPEYLQLRIDSAAANVKKNLALGSALTTRPATGQVLGKILPQVNAMISETVIGDTPRKFLVQKNLLKKVKRRNGRVAYARRPNARDVMTHTQLDVVKGLEHCARIMAEKATDSDRLLADIKAKMAMAKQVFEPLHDTYSNPTRLEDVKICATENQIIPRLD